jgi:hypothetical protein
MKYIIQVSAMVTGMMQYDPATGVMLPMGDKQPFDMDARQSCLVISKPDQGEVDALSTDQKQALGRAVLADFLGRASKDLAESSRGAVEMSQLNVVKGNEEVN